MITLLALLISLLTLGMTNSETSAVVTIPACPTYAPSQRWDDLSHDEYVTEYADEFTELFNSYETKVAKNGRIMIRTAGKGSFKFAKMGN